MGVFVISKRLNGDYKYEFKSRKGKTIFTSKKFDLRFECENEIELLKTAFDKCIFTKFKTPKGLVFFKVFLEEKEIATSRKYSTQLLLQKGIDEILKHGSKAEILDFSSVDLSFLNNQ